MASRTPSRTPSKYDQTSLEEQLRNVQRERDELIIEVRQLSRSQDPASSSVWAQIGATTRELRRAEDEIVSLRTAQDELQEELSRMTERNETLRLAVPLIEAKNEQNELLIIVLKEEMRKTNELACEARESKERLEEELDRAARKSHCMSQLLQEKENELVASEMRQRQIEQEHAVALAQAVAVEQSRVTSAVVATEEQQMEASFLRTRLAESEKTRRDLLNQVHELKGNVRVMVRVRPLLASDQDTECIKCLSNNSTIMLENNKGNQQTFTLDHVFDTRTRQEGVFAEVEDLIQSSMDGYKVCILSYGQTGSGKTHTMSGGSNDERGIVPRSIERVITRAMEMTADKWRVTASIGILELYNETFRDLLSAGNEERVKVGLTGDGVLITGLTTEELQLENVSGGLHHFMGLLRRASSARAVACTELNDQSSRSHMVFLIDITCRHANGSTFSGGLRFVDLAGSERLDRTGTANDAARLRETVNINKSLSSLADVFSAIGSKQSHVPFRNSKLTTVLQDCLTGEGKTLMLVNVSPALASSPETLCSLRFATQVNRVELGKATKNFSIAAPTAAVPQRELAAPSLLSTSALSTERSRPAKRQLNDDDGMYKERENRPNYRIPPAIRAPLPPPTRAPLLTSSMGAKRVVSTVNHNAPHSFLRESIVPSFARDPVYSSHSFLSSKSVSTSQFDNTDTSRRVSTWR